MAPEFKVCNRLISVDGPDGTGKSLLANTLGSVLRELFPHKGVSVIRPTYFNSSESAQSLGREFERRRPQLSSHSREHNAFFLEAMQLNYRDVVIPALASGRFIVLDSSEIRSLAFISDVGEEAAFSETLEQILSGALTCGLLPLIRVILTANPEDIARNLATKPHLDTGDPRDVKAIIRRQNVYGRITRMLMSLPGFVESEWVKVKRSHLPFAEVAHELRGIVESRVISFLQGSQIDGGM